MSETIALQLLKLVMARTGAETAEELARDLRWIRPSAVTTPKIRTREEDNSLRVVKNWLSGKNAPSFPHAMLLLSLGRLLAPEAQRIVGDVATAQLRSGSQVVPHSRDQDTERRRRAQGDQAKGA